MHSIEILSKDGCHLCERAIDILKELSKEYGLLLQVVDITKDEALYKDFFLRIPVVKIDGKIVFEAQDIHHPNDYKTKFVGLVRNLSHS